MGRVTRAALALLAAVALWAAAGTARGDTYAEVQVLDRIMDGCLRERVAGEPPCGYAYRTTLHLGAPLLPAWPWLEVYAEHISHARNAAREPGHYTPVASGLGAGVEALLGPWRITVGGHSTHCADRACRSVPTYNHLTIRYTLGD